MKMNSVKVILIAIAFGTASFSGYAQQRGPSMNGKSHTSIEHKTPAKPGNSNVAPQPNGSAHHAPNTHYAKPAPKPMPQTAYHNHGYDAHKPAPQHNYGPKPVAHHHHYTPAPTHAHHFAVAHRPAPNYYPGMVVRELPCDSYTTYIHNGERYYSSMGVLFKAVLLDGLVHLLVM